MAGGLTSRIGANDHLFLSGQVTTGPLPLVLAKWHLRKCDEICEILAPRVFHAVRQDDNAFW